MVDQDTIRNIAWEAITAGVPASDNSKVQTAVAVALAETGGTGDPKAFNGVAPDQSYGLWQINMLGSLGPDRVSKLGLSSYDQLFNPSTNATAMALISNKGQDWSAWSTYNPGKNGEPPAYLTYLPAVRAALPEGWWVDMNADAVKKWEANTGVLGVIPGSAQANKAVNAAGSLLTGGTGNWQDALKTLTSGGTWSRVVKVVGGVVLLGGAFFLLANRNGAVTDAAKAGAKVAAL